MQIIQMRTEAVHSALATAREFATITRAVLAKTQSQAGGVWSLRSVKVQVCSDCRLLAQSSWSQGWEPGILNDWSRWHYLAVYSCFIKGEASSWLHPAILG